MPKSWMHLLLAAAIALLTAACTGDEPGEAETDGDTADPRPSIVLVVIDTLRADAVSAYGRVDGTTPHIDALVREGVLYRHAWATSPWTLPSHASLFTGTDVETHRVGMPGRVDLDDSAVTLAELLGEAGYDTAAISENLIVSDTFALLQGFDWKRTSYNDKSVQPSRMRWIDASDAIEEWVADRDDDRPFFLFINLFDPHNPYEIRDENPWVPEDATNEDIQTRPPRLEGLICTAVPPPPQREVLRGLYHGDVHAGDAKLNTILERIRAVHDGPIHTVITSDHGEAFGERDLMGHGFGLQESVLWVPLIVHGVDGVEPALIDGSVGLIDILPTILGWAGLDADPELPGRPLPTTNAAAEQLPARSLRAAYSDRFQEAERDWTNQLTDLDKLRQFCGTEDRVFGGMYSLLRYPYKFTWYEQYPPELFDLSWDATERSDQSALQKDVLRGFLEEVGPAVESAGLKGGPVLGEGLSPERRRALEELGYIATEEENAAPDEPTRE